MPVVRNEKIAWADAPFAGAYHLEDYLLSNSSPRKNGELVLRQNAVSRRFSQVVQDSGYPGARLSVNGWNVGASSLFNHFPSRQLNDLKSRLTEVCRAKVRGKLYSGSAALGITAIEYRASREMIVTRSKQIIKSAESLAQIATKAEKSKRLASTYLEGIFGWQPLLTDIHAAASSVIQDAGQLTYIKASARDKILLSERWQHPQQSNTRATKSGFCEMRVRYSALVEIVNENRWLLERAGLSNPAAVAWDLVPWSFLVNQFVSVGSMVNSITDFAGLEFRDHALTTAEKAIIECSQTWPQNRTYSRTWTVYGRRKGRSLNGNWMYQTPALRFKLPNVNWEWAVMMSSLAVQQAVPLLRVAGKLKMIHNIR